MLSKCWNVAVGLVVVLALLSGAIAQDEEQAPVELGLKIRNAKIVDSSKMGSPSAEMTAEVTVKNKGSEIIGVSAGEFKFFLFDSKDEAVFMLSWDEPLGPDAAPLQPGKLKTIPIKCYVTYVTPSNDKPYRLVTIGYGKAALTAFSFQPKSKK